MRTHVTNVSLALAVLATGVALLPFTPLGLPSATADGDLCAALWPAARAPGQAVQYDAYAPGDASDLASDARPLADVYSWGYLDAPVERDAADLDDWYSVVVETTAPTPIMFEVNATLGNMELPAALAENYPEVLRYRIDAWPPGAATPLVGEPNGQGGAAVRLVTEANGLWRLHVHQAREAGAGVICHEAHPNPPPTALYDTPWPANYGVYAGCHPMCLRFAR